MAFFWIQPEKARRRTGTFNYAYKWGLPGVRCPVCEASWAGMGEAYPCVDLSRLPEAAKLREGWLEEDFNEFARLREMVRPLLPSGVPIGPGAAIGPLVGPASGNFGPLNLVYSWLIVILPNALEALKAEGIRGLKGCPTELRFRRKEPPQLLELQIEPYGLLHRDCIPPDMREPCVKCGRQGFALPEEPILELVSLPTDRDLFRLANFTTMIVVTERFVDAVRRLGFEGVMFQELPVR